MTCVECAGRTRVVRTVQTGEPGVVRVRVCLRCGAVLRTYERALAPGERPGAVR
jgi:transcriptional regulator NrdR family protein